MYQASNANSQISNTTFGNQQQNHNSYKQYEFNTDETIPVTQQLDQNFERNIDQAVDHKHSNWFYGRNDSISFAFAEIGAIINSKDFEDLSEQKTNLEQTFQYNEQTQQSQQQEQIQQQKWSDDFLNDQNIKYRVNNQQEANNQVNFCDNYQQLKDTIYEETKASFYDQTTTMTSPDNITMATRNNPSNKNYLFNTFDKSKPYVEIVEQPAKCSLRFRYKCEGRSAGSLPGLNSTADTKTYPAIRIMNYVGRAVVVISCVTKDAPYKSHPHNIVGKEGCKKGICTLVINNDSNVVRSFSSLGIQCVKRKDIEESLTLRESINVDPFRNGFAHKICTSNIDLNVVRLCFQVFIEGSTANKCDVPLAPVVSDPIHDKKAMSDLVITKLSHCSAPATGGREVILLCDRISKDDIQIRFYEERDGKVIWEVYSELSPTDVHKQVAICFKTPKYYNENITQPVMVRIQLKRVSDNQVSEPRLFQFLPCESDEDIISRKRQKIEWVNINHYALDTILQPQSHQHQHAPISQSPHLNQQQQHKAQSCLVAHQQQQQNQNQRQPEGPPSPLQPQNTSPNPLHQQHETRQLAVASSGPSRSPTLTPSPTNQQQEQQQQQNRFMIDSQDLVVRREIIDNEGKVMRLVDRPIQQRSQEQETNNIIPNKPLGSSLDRIDTAELMRDMTFNSNMDFNLGSSLSIHLNGPESMQMDQNQQVRASTSARVREISCNSNSNKNC